MPLPPKLLQHNTDMRDGAHRCLELIVGVDDMPEDTETQRAAKLRHASAAMHAIALHLQNWIAHADAIDVASEGDKPS